jgi:hypothetical protein
MVATETAVLEVVGLQEVQICLAVDLAVEIEEIEEIVQSVDQSLPKWHYLRYLLVSSVHPGNRDFQVHLSSIREHQSLLHRLSLRRQYQFERRSHFDVVHPACSGAFQF